METSFEHAVIRIFGDGEFLGAGVVIIRGYAVTCAHLFDIEEGGDYVDPHNINIEIEFPAFPSFNRFSALLEAWMPRTNSTDVKRELNQDIAVLKIPYNLPFELLPPLFIWEKDAYNDQVAVIGFDEGFPKGVIVEGRVVGKISPGIYQIEEHEIGYRVEGGFSGSPVWDFNLGGIIGIIHGAGEHEELGFGVRTAFIIPFSAIIKVWPKAKDARILYRPAPTNPEVVKEWLEQNPNKKFLLRWTLACSTGLMIGVVLNIFGAIYHAPYITVCCCITWPGFLGLILSLTWRREFDNSNKLIITSVFLLTLLGGISIIRGVPISVLAACVGTSQWLVLKDKIKFHEWWIFTTLFCSVIINILLLPIGFGISISIIPHLDNNSYEFLRRWVSPGIGVIVASIAQWFILKRNFSNSGYWLVTNLAYWTLAIAIFIFLLTGNFGGYSLPDDISTFNLFFFILSFMAILLSFSTGFALLHMNRFPKNPLFTLTNHQVSVNSDASIDT